MATGESVREERPDFAPRSGEHATPAMDPNEREKEEKKFGEGMPDQLAVEVLEGHFTRGRVRRWSEAKAENPIEKGAIATVDKKDEEGGESKDGMSS